LTLKSILALHENFLKALSIHFAHNGLSTPAELGSLLKTVTCLWKKHVVRKEDIQRMLALYEISAEQDQSAKLQPGCNVSHKDGPFQLTSSGAAGNMRVCVEYVGAPDLDARSFMRSPFSEKDLQYLFELDLLCLYQASRNKSNTHLSFLSGSLADFPLLSCTIGTQSTIRREKSSARRMELLSISTASQQRQQKKVSTQADPFTETSDETGAEVALAVKSRTQSLFDRIAARQAVNTSSSIPTAADILRRHAVGRISEIVEILRMKQQQKSVCRNHLLSNTNTTSPTRLGQRVSFSMKQLQVEIRDSASVPIGDDEIRLCLKMLADEDATKNWLKMLDSGVGERMSVFVVLEGSGMPGRDVQRILAEKVV
jgi:DNA replication factor Cdt1 C-terminal domain